MGDADMGRAGTWRACASGAGEEADGEADAGLKTEAAEGRAEVGRARVGEIDRRAEEVKVVAAGSKEWAPVLRVLFDA